MNRWDGYGELYHHGILGQKWGIRRYQNEDGSLTEEGKKRYHFGNEQIRKDKFLPAVDAYNKDTETATYKDVRRTLHKTKEYNIAGLSAGINDALGVAAVSLLAPSTSVSPVSVVGAMAINKVRRTIYKDGQDKALKALGYANFSDMYVKEYDKKAKNAGYPGMKETYDLLYGKEMGNKVFERRLKDLNENPLNY